MKKILSVFLALSFIFSLFPISVFASSAMISTSVAVPVITKSEFIPDTSDCVIKLSFTSAVRDCETIRTAYLDKLTDTYSEEEILHSDAACALYRTRTFCEITAGDSTYLISKPITSTKSVSLSLADDILPAMKKGGFDLKSNINGFDFTLRLITASENYPEKPSTVFVLSSPSEEKSFSCPAFCCICYTDTEDADMSGTAPAFVFSDRHDSTVLGIPSRSGYTFGGWKKANGYYTDTFFSSERYLEVAPQWQPKTFAVNYVLATDIKFNFGRANNRDNPTKYTVGIAEPLYEIKSPVGGYTFDGWYDNRNFRGEKLEYIDGKIGDILLYAKWISDEDKEAREKGTKEEYAASFHFGDTDLDGTITAADARLVLRAAVDLESLSAEAARRADVLSTGGANTSNARMILRIALGLESLYDILTTYDTIPIRR